MTEKNKKVLLVEDDSAIIDIYTTAIKKAGFDVEVLSYGQEVIKKIKDIILKKSVKPDIVLLDLVLPDVSGLEVLKEIKQSEITRDIKVFILTNQQDTQEFMNDFKPDQFLIKANTTTSQLVELIKKTLL